MSAPLMTLLLLMERQNLTLVIHSFLEHLGLEFQQKGLNLTLFRWNSILTDPEFFDELEYFLQHGNFQEATYLGINLGGKPEFSRPYLDFKHSGNGPHLYLTLAAETQLGIQDPEQYVGLELHWLEGGRLFNKESVPMIQRVVSLLTPEYGCLVNEGWQEDFSGLRMWKYPSPIRILGPRLMESLEIDPMEVMTHPDVHEATMLDGSVLWLCTALWCPMEKLKEFRYDEVEKQVLRARGKHDDYVNQIMCVGKEERNKSLAFISRTY